MKKHSGLLLLLIFLFIQGCSDELNTSELVVAGKWHYVLTHDLMYGEFDSGGGNRAILEFSNDKLKLYTSNGDFVGKVNFRINRSHIIHYGVNEFTGEKWESSPSPYYFKQDTLVIRDQGLEYTDNYYVRIK